MMATPRPRDETITTLRAIGVIPVIRADSAEIAVRISETLIEAGLGVIELTMTVPDAIEAIALVASRFGHRIVLGAGTVTDALTVRRAVEAGAEFIVSPCVVPEVVAEARAASVAILPGALTPTEVFGAFQAGADLVKVFPAQSVGGPEYIKALKGPFPHIPLVPTGGVNLQTIGAFLKAGADAVGVGGELIPREALKNGDYRTIAGLARKFLDAVKDARK